MKRIMLCLAVALLFSGCSTAPSHVVNGIELPQVEYSDNPTVK